MCGRNFVTVDVDCPRCGAKRAKRNAEGVSIFRGEWCKTPTGKEASIHAARIKVWRAKKAQCHC